jgi:hypothetical protein
LLTAPANTSESSVFPQLSRFDKTNSALTRGWLVGRGGEREPVITWTEVRQHRFGGHDPGSRHPPVIAGTGSDQR